MSSNRGGGLLLKSLVAVRFIQNLPKESQTNDGIHEHSIEARQPADSESSEVKTFPKLVNGLFTHLA